MSKPKPDVEETLLPEEMAAILRVKEQTLAKMRMQGRGPPFFRDGRIIRYTRQGAAQYMADRTLTSTSEE